MSAPREAYTYYDRALVEQLRNLIDYGTTVTVRGSETREFLMHRFTILEPQHRIAVLKHRNGNIFAQIAEALWVLAGRNDLDFLERYIPNCRKWSDDGKTWRAGYGPRLRNWPGAPVEPLNQSYLVPGESIDQITYVVRRLQEDPFTRQAIISLWDPARDNIDTTRDFPCNNWLHFIQRDGKLHLNIVLRSNDVMFGFSHADFFIWSLLQEAVAFWTGLEIGQMVWNATSFHLYDRHYDKAHKIVKAEWERQRYAEDDTELVHFPHIPFQTPFHEFDYRLTQILRMELCVREGNWSEASDILKELEEIKDTLYYFAVSLWIYGISKNEPSYTGEVSEIATNETVNALRSMFPPSDLRVAVFEYMFRKETGGMTAVHSHLTTDEASFLSEVL